MAIIIGGVIPPDRNYDQLRADIANWMNRTDLTAVIPSFIANAEARINTDLRLRRMIASTTLPTLPGMMTALPTGWLEFKSLSLNGRALKYMSPDQLSDRFLNCSGQPYYFSVEGSEVLLGPSPDGAYNVDARYYTALDPLSQTSTNWLLSTKPNVYLYAALAEGCLFIKKPDEAASWAGLYGGLVEAMQKEDSQSTHGGSTLVVRAR